MDGVKRSSITGKPQKMELFFFFFHFLMDAIDDSILDGRSWIRIVHGSIPINHELLA